jgi:alkanesulfonate monooxygenase SsuD/methylene tetrahydromethanopterin reductase-like flavin-dependent oxidoreductase (luciferase family)
VREVAEHVSIGGIGPVVVGSPATVADEIEAWIEETDVDGFNLAFACGRRRSRMSRPARARAAAPRPVQARL